MKEKIKWIVHPVIILVLGVIITVLNYANIDTDIFQKLNLISIALIVFKINNINKLDWEFVW